MKGGLFTFIIPVLILYQYMLHFLTETAVLMKLEIFL